MLGGCSAVLSLMTRESHHSCLPDGEAYVLETTISQLQAALRNLQEITARQQAQQEANERQMQEQQEANQRQIQALQVARIQELEDKKRQMQEQEAKERLSHEEQEANQRQMQTLQVARIQELEDKKRQMQEQQEANQRQIQALQVARIQELEDEKRQMQEQEAKERLSQGRLMNEAAARKDLTTKIARRLVVTISLKQGEIMKRRRLSIHPDQRRRGCPCRPSVHAPGPMLCVSGSTSTWRECNLTASLPLAAFLPSSWMR
jgi:DNA repair exonuclease SbcCD ATPase subunit